MICVIVISTVYEFLYGLRVAATTTTIEGLGWAFHFFQKKVQLRLVIFSYRRMRTPGIKTRGG